VKLHSLTVALIAMSTLSVACGDKNDDTGDTGHADHDHDGDGDGDDDADADGTDADGTDADGTDADGTDADGTDADGTDADGTDADGEEPACGEPTVTELEGYYFDSAFVDDASSVSNTGQIMRQVLMTEMKAYVGDLTDMVDDGDEFAAGDVVSGLMYYFDFNAEDADDALYATPDNALQTTWGEISTKNLVGKIAGNDSATDHTNWTDTVDEATGDVTPSSFAGFPADGVNSPESLVMHWFNEIEANVLARAEGDTDALANPVYLTADGVDRQQLLQKFLTGAVTFSQGSDDYLDNDVDGKGLLASAECSTDDAGECKKYSALEHAWDEGFGYFGGARNYGLMTAADIKANENDANGDECMDLITEYNWGGSVNAAKRDVGSADLDSATDFVGEAWTGFHDGRAIIDGAGHDVDGLNDDEMTDLVAHRDMAIAAWEKAIAATVVHYINDMKADLMAAGTDAMAGVEPGSEDATYSFADYAKHWGEAKGFGLWFQFNPNSPMSAEQFATLHEKLGWTAPGYVPGSSDDYMPFYTGLEEASTLLGEIYGFDDELLAAW